MHHWNNQPWQRNLSKIASGKTGAVQDLQFHFSHKHKGPHPHDRGTISLGQISNGTWVSFTTALTSQRAIHQAANNAQRMVRAHPLFKINIAEQGTCHRIIATHHNLDRMRGQ